MGWPALHGVKWLKFFRHEALLEQDGRCAYCAAPITWAQATADHKWPRSRRGGISRDNIAAACKPCNRAKGDRSHVEFYKIIDRKFPHGEPPAVLLIWASRRIWKRTKRACERIERACR